MEISTSKWAMRERARTVKTRMKMKMMRTRTKTMMGALSPRRGLTMKRTFGIRDDGTAELLLKHMHRSGSTRRCIEDTVRTPYIPRFLQC
jgi:hypothetical protein